MSGFVSRWRLQSMWTTFICFLILREGFATNSCEKPGTVELQAGRVHHILSFPSRSGHYPPECQRQWRIIAHGSGCVELHLFELDIEASENCRYDNLTIYSEYPNSRQLIANLCGTLSSQNGSTTIISPTPSVLVKFTSDHFIQRAGFSLYYVNGRDEIHPNEAIILSATYADNYLTYPPDVHSDYPNNANRTWRIVTPSATQRLHIFLVALDIEMETSCAHDALTIYDGYDSEAPVLKKLCGEMDNNERTFISRSQYLFLQFTSDDADTGKGFKLLYNDAISETTCNSDLNAVINLNASRVNEDLTSPEYPSTYPSNCRVQWRIKNPLERLRFEVQALDIEDKSECGFDSLTFYDGYDDSAITLEKLCGYPSEDSRTFVSSSEYVYVRFISDGYRQGLGFQVYFRAEGETIDTKKKGSDKNVGEILGSIFGVYFLLLFVGVVIVLLMRSRRRQQRQHSAQSCLANATSRSQLAGLCIINPSASPPYETLNNSTAGNSLSSFSNAKLNGTDQSQPSLYSNVILSDDTVGQTNSTALTGAHPTASYMEHGDIYQSETTVGANTDNQVMNRSLIPNSDQEP